LSGISGTRSDAASDRAIVVDGGVLEAAAAAAVTTKLDTEELVRTARGVGTELLARLQGHGGLTSLEGTIEETLSSVEIGILVTARVVASIGADS